MKIDVITFKDKLRDNLLLGNTVIVVDVLRCTTSLITAVLNGAGKIIPTTDPGEAVGLASRIGTRECVIGGERGGLKLADFTIGNSPFEYSKEMVAGRTVIVSTSNGTAAICAAKSARRVLLGALINCDAVAKMAAGCGDDILIVCAGTDGVVSADDLFAAGAIINRIRSYANNCEITDIGAISEHLYLSVRSGKFDLSSTCHYSRLMRLGFQKDIEYCMQEDITDCVPIYANDIITKA